MTQFWRIVGRAFSALSFIVTTIVLTAWSTGQPLKGLTKFRGLYKTLFESSVPAWAFALTLICTFFSCFYALRHLYRNRRGKIHFVPDGQNSGWSRQSDKVMHVQLGGTFTYEGPEERIMLLKGFVKGSQPANIDANLISTYGSGGPIATSELDLQPGVAQPAILYLRLSPSLRDKGCRIRKRAVLRDNHNRDFSLGKVEFPYFGNS